MGPLPRPQDYSKHKDGLGELQERLQLKAGEVWREHSTAKGAGLPDVLGPHPLSGARM